MKTPSALLLAGTVLVAGSAALLARVLLTPPPPPPPVVEVAPVVEEPAPTFPPILVAARDLQPGDFIDAGALQWQEADQAHEKSLYFVKGHDVELTGASVRQPVKAGTPLTSNLVVSANEPGFIATVIQPGMRAIAVPTSNTASLYGMLASGDRVDVLVNLERDKEQPQVNTTTLEQVPRLAAQTLLQNVRVLSLNNRVRSPLQPRVEESGKGKSRDQDAEGYPAYPRADIVTLEVPPAYAERLAIASQIGTLQLVLRSSQERGDGLVRAGNGRVTTLTQTTGLYRSSAASVQTFHGDTANSTQFGN